MINHVYGEFYGLYSDIDYDAVSVPAPEEVFIDDGLPVPAPTYLDKPLCTMCGEVNLSLRSDCCIQCRVGISPIGKR